MITNLADMFLLFTGKNQFLEVFSVYGFSQTLKFLLSKIIFDV